MSEKLDKLRASLEKERERRIKINTRIESLERRIQEAEAAEVNEMVRTAKVTPEQLAALLRLFSSLPSFGVFLAKHITSLPQVQFTTDYYKMSIYFYIFSWTNLKLSWTNLLLTPVDLYLQSPSNHSLEIHVL